MSVKMEIDYIRCPSLRPWKSKYNTWVIPFSLPALCVRVRFPSRIAEGPEQLTRQGKVSYITQYETLLPEISPCTLGVSRPLTQRTKVELLAPARLLS